MSNPIFCKNMKKKNFRMLSGEMFTQHASFVNVRSYFYKKNNNIVNMLFAELAERAVKVSRHFINV